jgi:glucose-1-phosphate thymidylyltransferase
MIGIILCGGSGTRLMPVTKNVNKHFLAVYNKPMIYYSLSLLMMAKIKEIIIISSTNFIKSYEDMLGNGSSIGVKIHYIIQKKPEGLPQAFTLSESLIKNKNVCLVLGDNFLYGNGLYKMLLKCKKKLNGALIFSNYVSNPQNYAVIKFKKDKIENIVEKPKKIISNYAVPGVYFFDKTVSKKSLGLKKSKRGEYEIVDLIKTYLKEGSLDHEVIKRGISWMDMGTFDDLLSTSLFVKTIEERQNVKIGSIEEISYRNGWISSIALSKLATRYKNEYGKYLKNLITNK